MNLSPRESADFCPFFFSPKFNYYFFLTAISQSRLCVSFAATLQPFSMCELFHAEGLVSPETAGVLANTCDTRSRCPCADSGALRERKKACNFETVKCGRVFFPQESWCWWIP